jgi:hypothetical protein
VSDPRTRRAVVALAVCVVGAILAVVALFALADADDDAEAGPSGTTLPEGDPVAADRIEVGDCFNDQDAIDLATLPVVPCGEPHDNEVYHLFLLPEPADGAYPGNERVASLTRDGCLAAFEPYVGTAYESSALEIFPIPPSEASWSGGDREVVCALYDARRQELTGSARGSAR